MSFIASLASVGAGLAATAGTIGSGIAAGAGALGSGLAAGAGAVGSGLGAAGSAIGSGLGVAGSALGSAGSAIGSGLGLGAAEGAGAAGLAAEGAGVAGSALGSAGGIGSLGAAGSNALTAGSLGLTSGTAGAGTTAGLGSGAASGLGSSMGATGAGTALPMASSMGGSGLATSALSPLAEQALTGAAIGGIGGGITNPQDPLGGAAKGAVLGGLGGAATGALAGQAGAGGVLGKVGTFAAEHPYITSGGIGLGLNTMADSMLASDQPTAPGIQYPNIDPNKFKYSQPQWSVYQPKYYAAGGITDLDAGDGIPSVQMMAIGGDVRKMADSLAKNSMFGFDSASDIPLIGGLFQKPEEIPQMATLTPEEKQKLMAMMEAKQSGQVQPIQPMQPVQNMARGGISDLGSYSDGGHLLKGPGDGVSDDIPAQIGNKQPARLADGEFVIPARIVSELGNGSTDAGARRLYQMMDRINSGRAKTTKKGKFAEDTKAHKHLPA